MTALSQIHCAACWDNSGSRLHCVDDFVWMMDFQDYSCVETVLMKCASIDLQE